VSAEQMLFGVFATIALGSALATGLFVRNLVAGAFCLSATLLSLAGISLLLGAYFVAFAQVVLHAGAVVAVLLFAILTGGDTPSPVPPGPRQANRLVLGATGLVMLFALVAAQLAASAPPAPAPEGFGGARQMAGLLFREFPVPLGLAGLLLLAAVISGTFALRRGAAE
jgi:NADH-quinone oxidoreductase subunit J